MPEKQQHVVPSFDSIDELRAAQDAKANFERITLYPRDGTEQLAALEDRLSELARVKDGELLLCTSGMAAVINSVEACLQPNQTIAVTQQGYSQTLEFTHRHLAERGFKVIKFDSGSPKDVASVISRHRPGLILSETVTNGPDTPVLDIETMLEACDVADIQPRIILDNTLPLSTGWDITSSVGPERQLLVVESATKAYTQNAELAGLVYSKNPELLDRIRHHRRTKGFGPNVTAVERIDALLPKNLTEFDERNLKIFKASSQLAIAAYYGAEGRTDLSVSHPALPNHPNQGLAKNLPYGASPVMFVQGTRHGDQYLIADRLWAHPDVRAQAELGQSFGFDTARILPDVSAAMVRISAGAETDTRILGNAIQEVLNEGLPQ